MANKKETATICYIGIRNQEGLAKRFLLCFSGSVEQQKCKVPYGVSKIHRLLLGVPMITVRWGLHSALLSLSFL